MLRPWMAVVALCASIGWNRCPAGEPATAPASSSGLKHEAFDQDPHWEGVNNRASLASAPMITQDFGFTTTHHATDGPGEIGGRVQRSTKPAYFAARIPPRTLDDPFTASGTFALTASRPSSGVFFGFFNADQPGASGRPLNSIGFDFDGESAGGRLAVRMINHQNESCGTFITPFVPGKYRPTPIRNNGTRYKWTLQYDPSAHGGGGRFTIVVTSNREQHEEFEGKTFTVDLPPGFKKVNATFDRFGLLDGMKTGNPMSIYFADLTLNGKPLDPSDASQWIGAGNHTEYREPALRGAHQFGFSEGTHFAAGAAPGEVGGDLWRSGKYAYYADRVEPALGLDRPLHAAGRAVLMVGAPDSDMYIGFFAADSKGKTPATSGNFLGVHVGGPTRVGHYFAPAYATAKGTTGRVKSAPVLVPGKPLTWSLDYDPAANGGAGAIEVRLGDEHVTLNLAPGARPEGARLDRFGLCTSNIGGQIVRIYFDDLEYTVKQ